MVIIESTQFPALGKPYICTILWAERGASKHRSSSSSNNSNGS